MPIIPRIFSLYEIIYAIGFAEPQPLKYSCSCSSDFFLLSTMVAVIQILLSKFYSTQKE